jgi:hypothetical protein
MFSSQLDSMPTPSGPVHDFCVRDPRGGRLSIAHRCGFDHAGEILAPRDYMSIRSTHCARDAGATNGSAKYCVSRATLLSLNSMMLTVYDGLPSYVRMNSVTQSSPLPIIRRIENRFLLG